MDTRVKPGALAHRIRSLLRPSVIAARKSLRVNGGFSEPPSKRKEGGGTPKGAPWVTAAAYFPDRRETEAHGNAFRRSVTAFFKTPVRSSGDLAPGDFAPLPGPVLRGTGRRGFSRPSLPPPSHISGGAP